MFFFRIPNTSSGGRRGGLNDITWLGGGCGRTQTKQRTSLAHHMEDNAETMLFQLIREADWMDCAGCVHSGQEQTGKSISVPFCSAAGNRSNNFWRSGGRDIVWTVPMPTSPTAETGCEEGASGTDKDESAGGTAYADGDGTAAAGKRLSGRERRFPWRKIYFRGEEKCETGYGRAGRAFAGCPDAADPQSCLESCRGMQRYYGGTFAGSGEPSGKTDRKICKTALWADRHKSLQCDRNHGKKKGNGKDLSADRYRRLPENLLAGEWKFSFKSFRMMGIPIKFHENVYEMV